MHLRPAPRVPKPGAALKLPSVRDGQLAWSTAAYPAVHKILTHPAYA